MTQESKSPTTPKPGPRPASTALEMYEKRLNALKARIEKDADAAQAFGLAEKLDEPNVLALHRLMHLFGRELVASKAEQALAIFQEAQNRGPEAYQKSEEGTAVATKKGRARSRGGVFFFVLRQHAESLGLNFEALYLPQLTNFYNPGQPAANKAKNPKPPATDASADRGKETPGQTEQPPVAASPELATTAPAVRPPPGKTATTEQPPRPAADKPARSKITVTGRLSGPPKLNPQGREGLVELVLETEMSQALPKGLPNLGATRTVVWCTQKQYNKVKDTLTPQSRLLIEGEPAPAVSSDFKPFLRVICLRLTTLELEQAQRAKPPEE